MERLHFTASVLLLALVVGLPALADKVVMVPYNANAVGTFDVATSTFSADVATGSLTADYKFSGAAAVGSKVVFAPCNANVVGVFDVATNTFRADVATGSLTAADKCSGAAAVGTKVVFGPNRANVVGVFDVSTNKFSTDVSTGGLSFAGVAFVVEVTCFLACPRLHLHVSVCTHGTKGPRGHTVQNSSGLRPESRFFSFPPHVMT